MALKNISKLPPKKRTMAIASETTRALSCSVNLDRFLRASASQIGSTFVMKIEDIDKMGINTVSISNVDGETFTAYVIDNELWPKLAMDNLQKYLNNIKR